MTVICVSVLLLIIAGCQREPVTIGFVGSLSGVHADLAVGVRNGAELAVEMHNSEASRRDRVQLAVRDDGYSTETALRQAKDLVENSSARVLIGFLTSGMVEAALSAAEQNPGVAVISPTISGRVPEHSVPFIRLIGSARIQGKVMAEHAYEAGIRSAVAVMDPSNEVYASEVVAGFFRHFVELGGTATDVVALRESGFEGFADLAAELRSRDYDALLTVMNASDTALFMQSLELHDAPARPVYAGMWAFTPQLLQQGGRSIEGLILSSAIDPAYEGESYREFDSRYQQRYRSEASFGSVLGYEAVLLAIEHLTDSSSSGLPEAAAGFTGLQSDVVIDQSGEVARRYFLFQVRGGQFVRLD